MISDGSELPGSQDGLEAALEGCVRRLRKDSGVEAVAVVVSAQDRDPAAAVHSVCDGEASACFVVHADPARAWFMRRALQAADFPVVSDGDLRAVAAAAQALRGLRRLERVAGQSAVVIADSDRLPEMGPLLTAVGIRDLTFWKRTDAPVFPLAQMAEGADLVVDLRAGDDVLPVQGQDTGLVLRMPDVTDSLPLLPGLLTAAAATGRLQADTDVLAAVAQFLAITCTDTALPAPQPELTDSIAWVARQAMRHPRGS
ncbi:hypothetical protein [Streptomyces longisporoflavus]|uniref:Uncharacterized protein n=1 Tax=Streptomyces longisporoflavus TaxID=28044 RepID=A0ABW7R3H6_9ACTN